MTFDYSDRYVAFIDILGFKEKVAKISENNELFDLIVRLPEMVAAQVASANEAFGGHVDAQAQVFSDSIIISASHASYASLYAVVSTVVRLSQELLLVGALVRGGLAQGPTHHRGAAAFGQAIIDAYELEQGVARVPRVVVAPEIAADWRAYNGPPGKSKANLLQMARDVDGVDFIDLFHFPERDSVDNFTFKFFKEGGTQLARLLSVKLPIGAWSKIVWLAQRYNGSDFVMRRGLVSPIVIPELVPPRF